MPVILYVEHLFPDKSIGMTSNQAMMMENANRIRITNFSGSIDDVVALVFQAGRYVAVIAPDINHQVAMMFFDCKQNEEFAEKISSQFEDDLRLKFMKNFYEVSENYKKNYSLVELEVGKGFPPDLIAN